jgi:TPR repeat protein
MVMAPLVVAASDDFAEGLALFDSGDLQAAYETWLPLADSGDVQAQVALAGLLESGGPGVPRDLAAAARWYERAARAGDPVAQMNLAEYYERGLGLAQDRPRALAWYTLAAEQGRGWAGQRRDELTSQLGPADRARATQLQARLRAGQEGDSASPPATPVSTKR